MHLNKNVWLLFADTRYTISIQNSNEVKISITVKLLTILAKILLF